MAPTERDKIPHILEAARKRFGHYGLAKTTMSEIATDIGMSKAAIYYYFPDKEHLFAAVVGREMESFINQMENLVLEPGPASEKIHQYVAQRFIYFQEFVNLGKIAGTAYEALKPAMASVKANFDTRERSLIRNIIQTGINSGEFQAVDAAVHADLFVSTLIGFRTMLIKQRDSFMLMPEDYDALSNYQSLFTGIFIRGISQTATQ